MDHRVTKLRKGIVLKSLKREQTPKANIYILQKQGKYTSEKAHANILGAGIPVGNQAI